MQRSIVMLLIGLSIFFNFEGLPLVHRDLDIGGLTYALGAAAAVLTIVAASWSGRSPAFMPMLLWMGVYLTGKLALGGGSGLSGGADAQTIAAEVLLLGSLVWLAHRVARNIVDLDSAAVRLVVEDEERLARTLDKSSPEIDLYFLQSRRYGRPLSIVAVESQSELSRSDVKLCLRKLEHCIAQRFLASRIARVIGDTLRRSDLLIEQDEKGSFIILCPESDSKVLSLLAERIEKDTARELDLTVACGVATFPNDALTFDDLARKAKANLALRKQYGAFAQSAAPPFTSNVHSNVDTGRR